MALKINPGACQRAIDRVSAQAANGDDWPKLISRPGAGLNSASRWEVGTNKVGGGDAYAQLKRKTKEADVTVTSIKELDSSKVTTAEFIDFVDGLGPEDWLAAEGNEDHPQLHPKTTDSEKAWRSYLAWVIDKNSGGLDKPKALLDQQSKKKGLGKTAPPSDPPPATGQPARPSQAELTGLYDMIQPWLQAQLNRAARDNA